MPYFLYYLYILPMLSVLDYLLLCCVDFENKISIYLSVFHYVSEATREEESVVC